MPNRILRDWTDSDRVNQLSTEAEVFFVRLIMKADDYGVFYAEPNRIKSACYPLKDSIRSTDISRWQEECLAAGLVRCFEASGCRYMCITNFGQRLRQMRRKFPAPPVSDLSATCQQVVSESPPTRHFPSDSDSVSDSQSSSKGIEVRRKGYPVTVDDAIRQCFAVGATASFVTHCFNKAESRGGKDGRGLEIQSFPSYVATELKYERDRQGKESSATNDSSDYWKNSKQLDQVQGEIKAIENRGIQGPFGDVKPQSGDVENYVRLKKKRKELKERLGLI